MIKKRFAIFALFSTVSVSAVAYGHAQDAAQAKALSPHAQLAQYMRDLKSSPDDAELRQKIIELVSKIKPKPEVPEEARRRLMRGNSAFKGATSNDDFDRAIGQYQQATIAAPWWPDPYFNLAKAQEARGRYDEAATALSLYLATKPSAADARIAQDMIYTLEDKKDKSSKSAAVADEARAKKQAETARLNSFEGEWCYGSVETCPYTLEIRKNADERYDVKWTCSGCDVMESIVITGRRATWHRQSHGITHIENYVLSEDGRHLAGTVTNQQGSTYSATPLERK